MSTGDWGHNQKPLEKLDYVPLDDSWITSKHMRKENLAFVVPTNNL